ncbi:MAG: alpha-2-macroglobulin family protein, partial [Planctomycetota bacterium]
MPARSTSLSVARGILLLLACVVLPACSGGPADFNDHGPAAGVRLTTAPLDEFDTREERTAGSTRSGGWATSANRGFGGYDDEAVMPAPSPALDPSPADGAENTRATEAGSSAPAADAPARKEFPESMLVEPMLITDANGKVTIGVERMPDSITTWKVRAIGHSIDGAFGEGSGTFRVFKDIFLNLQLPRVLTVGDELYVPLTVMNYSGATNDLDVAIQRETWLDHDADGSNSFAVDPNSSNNQYARVR